MRERREWIRLRELMPFLMSGVMTQKGLDELSKRMKQPFYWEKKKEERTWKPSDIETIKQLFNEHK